jgi:uncharacterized protein
MAEASADTLLRISRPTFTVGGQDNAPLADGLLELLIVENTRGLYRCEATFGNWGPAGGGTDYLYFDRQTFDFGKTFQVKLGADLLFDGLITALEARYPEDSPPELKVLAEDRFQDLRMTRRTVTYANVSDADVINQIASHHGLTPSVNVQGPTYKVLAQVNQSDLAFLRERCRTIDAELWMSGNTLNAQSRSARASAEALTLGKGHELRSISVIADLADQRSAVKVSGWDVSSKSALAHEAADSVIQGELEGGTSGASILASALGVRREAVVHGVPLSSREAQARAETFFKLSARRFVVSHGVAETDAKLRVGVRVDLQGLGGLFSGKYYVSEVKHLFDGAKGLRTEFVGERPGLGRAG